MSEHVTDSWGLLLICSLILFSGKIVAGDSLDTDREVLLQLKSYLNNQTLVDQGRYTNWNTTSSNPCDWSGIWCNGTTRRVVGIDLSDNKITGKIFQNFSYLTHLTHLDLSQNTLSGEIPEDLRRCKKLKYLNLSHNILPEELNLIGLTNLQILDLSGNRLYGDIGFNFPAICDNLVSLNISGNNFTGRIDECFNQCLKLQYLDLSTNKLSGDVWMGISKLRSFSVSENFLSGGIPPSVFPVNCSLEVLDISENMFIGNVPKEVANCKNLTILNLSTNRFNGSIPREIGSISGMEALYLGNNSFSRDIPEELLNLANLVFLDLTRNHFGGDIQEIFGRFKQVKYLLLHSNSYTGGLSSSGILKLPNALRLDLSNNSFSGPLPTEVSQMSSLKLLMLAYNQFTGPIPPEFGKLPHLQALDLSFNNLSGQIPQTLGNLTSLLWLMLANNSLTGEIPRELGKCSSLLWLNLANNKLTGKFPPELANIGRKAMATFESNRQYETVSAGSGECLAMKRWIPADYPPFSFVYDILTRKNCRSTWDRLLKGYGIFPICNAGSFPPMSQISGYVQLNGNQLSGEIPPEIGTMMNFSMLHLGFNKFSGKLPPEVKSMPLVVFNITGNDFSGEIPWEIGTMKCLMNLDLSFNNFSGVFPSSLSSLTELTKFNISYNPLISGQIPSTGQLATFEKYSYLGDPLLDLPSFIDNSTDGHQNTTFRSRVTKKSPNPSVFLVIFAFVLAFLVFGLLTIIVCRLIKNPSEEPFLRDIKIDHGSGTSSPWLSDTVKVIRLDRTAFTHADILKATGNFSDDRIIGKGGFGTVYRGIFSDGREVAVKKLQREGLEGEKEFRAEMEVLCGHGFGWPHPNLVTLYGWCLDGSEKLLVYEYISGGSLEDVVTDRTKFTWKRRLEVAIDVARALVYLHHECYPSIVHRDVKASNVLLDNKTGKAKVTDFGLARVVDVGDSHVSTMVAGTVGYVAPEYGHTWKATTKGDVYSYGVLSMELATGRRALDGGEECLVEWGRRVMGHGHGHGHGHGRNSRPIGLMGCSGFLEGMEEMVELLRIGVRCTAEKPSARPTMKEVLDVLIKVYNIEGYSSSSYENLSH